MLTADTRPSPRGMDRDGDDYRAAVQAAAGNPPALDAEQRSALRAIFTEPPARTVQAVAS
jgi:hypothetical protein